MESVNYWTIKRKHGVKNHLKTEAIYLKLYVADEIGKSPMSRALRYVLSRFFALMDLTGCDRR